MTEPLANREIRDLKARAQSMRPALTVGKEGLSDGFVRSIDEALSRHELVKVKFGEFKEQKKTLAPLLAGRTSAHLITRVGNVVVLFRRKPRGDHEEPINQKAR